MKKLRAPIAIVCKKCNWVGVSWFRHDFKTCDCDNRAMVDGGFDYVRYGAQDLGLLEMYRLVSLPKKKKRKAK